MCTERVTRRSFLKTGTSAVLAAPALIPSHVLGVAFGLPGANDRIRVGLIGAGRRARALLKESPLALHFVSLADCDLRQIADYQKWARETCAEKLRAACSQYQDYRQMLAKEKLDAVVVATTVHARALICIQAVQAGLDVYAEKPIALTIEEGQYLVRAERKYGRVFQTGTQQRSIPINNFGSDLVKNGAIGRVHTVTCPNFLGPDVRPYLPAEPTPAEMNWDLWCNQTALIAYSSRLHPGQSTWGRFRDYDGGGMSWGVSGWGTHAFDQVQRALGTDGAPPEEVWPESQGPNCPVTLRYPNGTLLMLTFPIGKGPALGAVFAGENYRRVVEWIRSGKLGPISVVRTFLSGNQGAEGIGSAPKADPPKGMDWNLWCGPAAMRPFNPLMCANAHTNCSFMDYSGGYTPGMAPHIIDLPFWALDLGIPLTTSASGGRYVTRNCGDAYDTQQVLWQWPKLTMTWMLQLCNSFGFDLQGASTAITRRLGVYFHAVNATLYADYGRHKVVPEGNKLKDATPPTKSIPPSPGHEREWLDSIRSRKQPSCNVSYHYRLDAAIGLANIAYKLGRSIRFDLKTEKIVGDEEAAKLARPDYRTPWKFPVKYLKG
ncbi:MAG: Gfo/Idh/MocA family oxidoreductase [Thermoguttaceae bacterium]